MRNLFCGIGVLVLLVIPASACHEKSTCGNDKIQAGESCDGSNLGEASCHSLGYAGGTLGCTSRCLFDVTLCEGLVDCGNDVVDTGEQCDGSDLDGQTCESLGLGGGSLGCDPVTCQLVLSGCDGRGICGDGVAEGDEACDGLDLGGMTCTDLDPGYLGGTLSCSPSCTLRTSGCYTAPDFPIGEACASEDDCEGGLCYLEFGGRRSGAPGGMCYERCGEDNTCPLAGEAGVCAGSSGGPAYCYRRCDPAAPDCREGYECRALGDRGYCYPHCTDDAQCVVTGQCEDDPSADRYGFCVVPDEICSGGVDEDLDGLVDCGDPDCNGVTGCPLGEDCYDGVDNDSDGLVDCDDGECALLGMCTGLVCDPPAEATLSCGSSLSGENNGTTGSTNLFTGYECLAPDTDSLQTLWGTMSPEYAYRLTVSSAQLVTVTVSGFTGNLDAVVVKESQGQYCDPVNDCFAYGNAGTGSPESITFAAYPTVAYYVIVDGRMGAVSDYDIAVTCDATTIEDCGNAVDDDGDTLVDCADPECMGVPPDCAP